MALTNTNSELITAYINKQRTRTMNYRGSMLCTSIEAKTTVTKDDVGSIFNIALMPYTATLKHFEFAFDTAIKELAFTIGIAGINRDNTFTEIKSDLLTWEASEKGALVHTEIVDGTVRVKTIYEQLCSGDPILPIDAFGPYVKDKYGVLYLKTTTQETTNSPTQISINIEYVEASPSMALLTKTSA